jgi:hypothetical protein
MEIPPVKADLAQIIRGKEGRMVTIDNDVQGVANALSYIDHHLRLRFSEAGGYFVVYWKPDEDEEGSGYLVTTAQELDHRIIKTVEEVYWKVRQPGYSFAGELEKVEAAEKKAIADAESEVNGEVLERLAFAMRKDRGYDKQRAFVPTDLAKEPDDAA